MKNSLLRSFLIVCLAVFALVPALPVMGQQPAATPAASPTPVGPGGPQVVFGQVSMEGKPVTLIAIPGFTGSGGAAITPQTLPEIIYNDLELFADFKRVANPQFVEEAQSHDVATNQVDFMEWMRLRANLVLKGTISVAGNRLTADCMLYDIDRKTKLFGLRYADFSAQNPRKLAHRISDDIVKYVLKDTGIAGTQIAFVSSRTSSRVKEIYVMDADGFNQRRVTSDNSIALTPAWGMNAAELYFTSYRDRYPDLCGVILSSSKVWYISRREGLNTSPAWNPQNQRIVCTLGKDGNSELYLMGRDGRGLQRLTNDRAIDSSPCWSPDGSQITFSSDRTGSIHIYVMNANGSNQRRITFSGTYNESPVWSPKGDRIAFIARDQGMFDIYTMSPDGSGLHQLTANAGKNEDPYWAPDGKHIVFSSNRTGRYQIYIMRDDGTNVHQLTREGIDNMQPSWSPVLQ